LKYPLYVDIAIEIIWQVTNCNKIFEIGSPPDPWKNHNIALSSRLNGTAAWFIQGDTFSEWKIIWAKFSSMDPQETPVVAQHHSITEC